MIESCVTYLDRLKKQSDDKAVAYSYDAIKWCSENLKSDKYEIVDEKCVAKKKDK
jgi:hypothetical protein